MVAEKKQCGSKGDVMQQSIPESTASDRKDTVTHGD